MQRNEEREMFSTNLPIKGRKESNICRGTWSHGIVVYAYIRWENFSQNLKSMGRIQMRGHH